MMAKKKTPKGTPNDDWVDLLDEGGRSEVVEQMPKSRLNKLLKPYMWVATVALVPMLFLGIGTISNMNNQIEEVQTAVANQQIGASSQGRAVATIAIENWLAQPQPPLPGGRILSWDGSRAVQRSERVDENNQDVSAKDKFESEINTFTLVDEYHRLWTASVLVKIDPRGGAKAEGGPSLMPKVSSATDGWEEGSPWPGIESDPSVLTDPLKTAVNTWAEAFTSGDPSRLTVAVGDPDNSHVYVPMSGIQSVEVNVTDGATQAYGVGSVVIAQVQLDILWAGQSPPQSGSTRNTVSTTFDVLVDKADTASPLVVAWGAPGSGPTLVKYTNAVTGRPVDQPATPVPTPSASPSATNSDQPSAPASTTPSPTATGTP